MSFVQINSSLVYLACHRLWTEFYILSSFTVSSTDLVVYRKRYFYTSHHSTPPIAADDDDAWGLAVCGRHWNIVKLYLLTTFICFSWSFILHSLNFRKLIGKEMRERKKYARNTRKAASVIDFWCSCEVFIHYMITKLKTNCFDKIGKLKTWSRKFLTDNFLGECNQQVLSPGAAKERWVLRIGSVAISVNIWVIRLSNSYRILPTESITYQLYTKSI